MNDFHTVSIVVPHSIRLGYKCFLSDCEIVTSLNWDTPNEILLRKWNNAAVQRIHSMHFHTRNSNDTK